MSVDDSPPRFGNRFHEPFWSFHPLGVVAKAVLLVFVAVVLLTDALVRVFNPETEPILSAVVITAITISMALFTWRPPLGTLALACGAGLALLTGVGGEYLLGAALVTGIVSLTCSAALTLVYTIGVLAWSVAEGLRPSGSTNAMGIVVISLLTLASFAVGATIRQQHERWSQMSEQMEQTERAVAEQLRHERDLIADELHDIVAHELTIIALHAAVLDRTDDSQTRVQSQSAIRDAAVQALTDLRRVLGMVRGEENLAPERVPATSSLDETLAQVVGELETAGIEVTVERPDEVDLPGATVLGIARVLQESATNVIKHAADARRVTIVLRVENEWVQLSFSDDSPAGRTAGLPTSGYGIMRLRERFRVFGGSFDARRTVGGWTVTAALPLQD